MKTLNYKLSKLCDQNAGGSFGTRDQRKRQLSNIADSLHKLGFVGIKKPQNLKAKHVYALVTHWQSEGLKPSTIKNRMSSLRWLAEQTNNTTLVAKTNDQYGIERRAFSTNEDKSLQFEQKLIDAIADPHVQFSARLQEAFGLRREEAMKFNVSVADKGDHIALKPSWTKGGRARDVLVETEEQRMLLNEIKMFAGNHSLIPANKTYVEQVRTFERHMDLVGLGRTHGARHAYAQRLYEKLTGWKSPAAGGPTRAELSFGEREKDKEARQHISRALGHERESITVVYLGR